jgi:hypothetical protein
MLHVTVFHFKVSLSAAEVPPSNIFTLRKFKRLPTGDLSLSLAVQRVQAHEECWPIVNVWYMPASFLILYAGVWRVAGKAFLKRDQWRQVWQDPNELKLVLYVLCVAVLDWSLHF